MLTMWPCKWNSDEEKWNMLSNGDWKTLAFSFLLRQVTSILVLFLRLLCFLGTQFSFVISLSLSLWEIRASALWRGANRAGAAGPWVCHFKVKGRGQVLASPFLFW
jgi:hypothetical protein